MPALETPAATLGMKAPDFRLRATDGKIYTLNNLSGPRGTLIMFICNHCPFVRAIIDRVVRDARELQALDVGVAAIMPNDTEHYPEDSFDHMERFAELHAFTFPYLIDETQEVAHAYGAVCTPDFFGFDAGQRLRYRGRLDSSRMEPVANAPRDLFEAMKQVAETGAAPAQQFPSIGCSIKWRSAA